MPLEAGRYPSSRTARSKKRKNRLEKDLGTREQNQKVLRRTKGVT